MTRLFIENREIELDESVQFAITKQFEDLSNPTTIINDWSKTVSIPFTARNNAIFGHIYNPDKLTVEGGPNQALTGIYFNPYKKLNMRLQWGDNVLMYGYAKMNEVKQVNGNGTYELTLFGQLGNLFQEMRKITFDTTTSDSDYLIDGEQWVDETLNKELIYSSWTTSGQSQSKLYPKWYYPPSSTTPIIHPAYKVTDIIGFAPNNSFSEGFNYDTYQTGSNNSNTFENALGDTFKNNTGIDASTVIPNGLLPREIGEYRSYLQLPFIYFNKLFQMFQDKAETVTGYKFNLDEIWFSDANPYWHDLVYMLKSFNPKNGNEFNNSYKENGSTITSSFSYNALESSRYSPDIIGDSWHDGGYINLRVVNEALPSLQGNEIHITKGSTIKFTTIPVDFSFTNSRDTVSGTHYAHYRLNNGHYPSFEISLYDENDNLISGSKKVFGLTYSGREVPASDLSTLGIDEIVYTPASVYCGWQSTYTFSLNLPYNKTYTFNSSASYKLRIRYKWNNISNTNHIPFASYEEGGEASWNRAAYCAPLVLKLNTTASIPIEITQGVLRSDVNFTINDLWNNDFNVFDEIVKYCKMFRICISVNEYDKTINFEPYAIYFKNYKVIDWTKNVDMSKDFIITPISFENKYVLFNYNDSKTKLGSEYKNNYGVNYGEYRLQTEYNFNTETTKLFDKITPSINNTDNVLSWTNIYDYHRIIYSFPAELYVYNKDKENKQQDIFGAYYFYNGIVNFDTDSNLHMRSVVITDDTAFQRNRNTYFYTQRAETALDIYTYPLLNIVKGDNMCLFNIPNENYTYRNNYGDKNSIYDNIWKTYLDERYNIQNKKVTCYVNLKPSDYQNFEWNKLVKINNQLFVVNKIYDYDITSNQPTKVDLVTIQDIKGYNDDTFIKKIDDLVLNIPETVYINGTTGLLNLLGTFTSASDVTFSNGSKTYTLNGVAFTIVGKSIYYQRVNPYVDKEDIEFTVTLKNSYNTTSFNCVRYSVYPYPWIIIEDSNGNEVSTIYPGSRVYKFKWHGTETEGLDNKPTITIENHGTGSATIGNDWVENQVMIAEGDDEWFRNEYEVTLNTNMTNYSGTYLRFIVTDKEGWHETRDYPISL